MLNCGFASNGGAVLWENAPMPEHNSNAQRLISAYPPKQPLLSFLKTNKRYIFPPSRLESLGRHVTPAKKSSNMTLPRAAANYFAFLGSAAGLWLSIGT